MEEPTPKYLNLISELLWIVQRDIKLTLGAINEEFTRTGLSFDEKFREIFLDLIWQKVEKAYDEFQLKLGLDELEQSYDLNVTNSNASLATWQKSSKNHNNTPTMPKSTTKRKRHEVNVMSDIDSTTKRAKFGEDDDEHKTIEGGDSFDDFDDVMMKEDEITEKETTNDENNYVKIKPTETPKSIRSQFEGSSSVQSVAIQSDSGESTKASPNLRSRKSYPKRSRTSTAPPSSSEMANTSPKRKKPTEASHSKDAQATKTRQKTTQESASSKTPPKKQTHYVKDVSSSEETDNDDEIAENTVANTSNKTNLNFVTDREKRFNCEKCTYSTSKKWHFTRHMDSHGKRPFQCQNCPFRFPDEKSLDVHMQKHSNTCKMCKKTFDTIKERDQHEATCNLCFGCRLCSSRFSADYLAIDHLKSVHGVYD